MGRNVAARKLHGGDGWVTPGKGQDCRAHAFHVRILSLDAVLDGLRDRVHDAVGQQHTEEVVKT